jgi:hypothetical protein
MRQRRGKLQVQPPSNPFKKWMGLFFVDDETLSTIETNNKFRSGFLKKFENPSESSASNQIPMVEIRILGKWWCAKILKESGIYIIKNFFDFYSLLFACKQNTILQSKTTFVSFGPLLAYGPIK